MVDEQVLSRVPEGDMNFCVIEHIVVERCARTGDRKDRRLKFNHVDSFHSRHLGKPSGSFARAETDNETAFGCWMDGGAHQTPHHLRCCVHECIAVDLAVHHKRQTVLHKECDTGFDSVGFPLHEFSSLIRVVGRRHRTHEIGGAPGADAGVAPRRRWTASKREHDRDPDKGGEPNSLAPRGAPDDQPKCRRCDRD